MRRKVTVIRAGIVGATAARGHEAFAGSDLAVMLKLTAEEAAAPKTSAGSVAELRGMLTR